MDWFCFPRFDSPSVFGALLDDARGGHFRVRPAGGAYESKQMYFPDSAALITRFFTADGVGEVVDFMPVIGRAVTANHRLVRMVRCVRGRMRFEVDIAPQFDYGRRAHRIDLTENGVVFSTDTLTLTLHAVREPDDARLAQAQVDEGDVRATIDLVAGQVRGVMLESAADGPPREVRPAEVWRLFDDTVAFWQSWLGHSTYRGRWREVVNRSAITLKLMTYAPTGGLVAAPTAALPEQVASRVASHFEEAEQFGVWLSDRIREHVGGASGGSMNTRTLRRTRRQVASTLDDVIDKMEDAASALDTEIDKAGEEVGAELATLSEQLQGLRRSIVETVEPYRPPKRYRPYVQLGVLVLVVAAVIAIVMRRRQGAARSAATTPDQTGYQHSSGDDGQHRPISTAPEAKSESEGQRGLV